MRLIGIVIAISLMSLLFVWWINLSLARSQKAITSTQQIEEIQNTESYSGTGPIDYSRKKVQELNEASVDRADEIEQILP